MNKQIRVNLFILLIIFTLTCLFLFYRISYIVFAYGKEYEKQVIEQNMSIDYSIPPIRGSIIDRNGELLGYSTKVYNVILDVAVLLNYDEETIKKSINTINELLDIDKESLNTIIDEEPTNRYKIIKKRISLKEADKITSHIKDGSLVGVWLEETTDRVYPNNHLAAHVIGFEGGDAGHWGVEETYDEWLRGRSGRQLLVTGPSGMIIEDYIPPTNGHDIILTIDETIQHFSEEVLNKYIKDQQPLKASIIIMNPNNGEILSMVSYPSFNLNDTDDIIGYFGEEDYEDMPYVEKNELLYKIWRNSNISDSFEPGSTYKPIIYAMALEEGLITVDDTFYCPGHKNIYGTTIRCWKRTGHGEQTLEEAIANSCNVAVMEVAELLGAETYYKYQQAFGVGNYTNIDLLGETAASSLVYNENSLGPVELATSSFGQGFNVTPIQLITANAAVVNGGYLVKPHVVSQIVDSNGVVVKDFDTIVNRKVISVSTSETMKHLMESTVDFGTAKDAQLPGYRIGGKTGTAQKGNRDENKYVVSFMSYAPVEDPKVMMLVVLDEPKDMIEVGSKIAVQISKDIYEYILPYLDIYPNYSTPH